MIEVMHKGDAPVAIFVCRWCGSRWRASTDEGIIPHIICGVSYPSMPCIVCKSKTTIGQFEEVQDDDD